MNVLFCARDNLFQSPAGDTEQILKTAAYLKSKGVQVSINSSPQNGSHYDLIHLFNLTPIEQTYACFCWAKFHNIKMVISPIYWNLERYYQAHDSNERLFLWKRYQSFRKEILEGCDMVFPSGRLEMENLMQEIEQEFPYTVIHNGVDLDSLNLATPMDTISLPPKPYILCAARICPRKNQLTLAKICDTMDQKLVLAGSINNERYFEKCLQYKNVSYAGFLEQKALAVLYENASLHVLPSFAETPGLASMEAAMRGCNIVSTSEGDASEYFEDMATYCDPYDENDIRRALVQGLSHDFQPRLKEHVIEKFGWESCLAPLYQSYLKVLS